MTTSYIQTTATLGVFLVVQVIGLGRYDMDAKAFARWGGAIAECRATSG